MMKQTIIIFILSMVAAAWGCGTDQAWSFDATDGSGPETPLDIHYIAHCEPAYQ